MSRNFLTFSCKRVYYNDITLLNKPKRRSEQYLCIATEQRAPAPIFLGMLKVATVCGKWLPSRSVGQTPPGSARYRRNEWANLFALCFVHFLDALVA